MWDDHLWMHQPLDTPYDLVVDETQMSFRRWKIMWTLLLPLSSIEATTLDVYTCKQHKQIGKECEWFLYR